MTTANNTPVKAVTQKDEHTDLPVLPPARADRPSRSAKSGFDREPQGILWYFEVLVDFVFMVDICLNFRTAAIDPVTKENITDTRQLSIRQG